MKLTLAICTFDPRPDHFQLTLDAIRAQWKAETNIELLIIDNASPNPLGPRIDLSWATGQGRVVREDLLGLTHARLRAFKEAAGEYILFVDDDNILSEGYIQQSIDIMDKNPRMAAVGGKVLPVFEVPPPEWFAETGIGLACRDLGDNPIEAHWSKGDNLSRSYPDCAPIGAGMIVRRSAFADYVDSAAKSPIRLALGRRGADLSSGEDNDMILTFMANGWHVGYWPELKLDHLIPASRTSLEYLKRYARSSNRTWVQVLAVHGIAQWKALPKWTVPFRAARAWLITQPWRSPAAAVRWQGQIGLFEGQATLREIYALRAAS